MKVMPLMPGQPVTDKGDAGSAALVEIIQRLCAMVKAVEAENGALRKRLDDAGVP